MKRLSSSKSKQQKQANKMKYLEITKLFYLQNEAIAFYVVNLRAFICFYVLKINKAYGDNFYIFNVNGKFLPFLSQFKYSFLGRSIAPKEYRWEFGI